ncbi:multiple sugar transport system permease protein/raffinose/stachyose/melibiose transport system permease protein [Jatrophihabitans sp. GAS493]|uniref:carbohydrate ABC transporter permease n=1 Tax=Jatrophihabitans sp. GAS493 TaxID=1907575 RepID=UPI000BB75A8E|nr:sugar ABC transporter permease [Jatrophihabitans sp. GAS493]SOD72084.1 multiple sugar transport system permease protein/raffinose/stachyose/melibiose transport system permease protein [Jatrophihabitans sp. GAS493]
MSDTHVENSSTLKDSLDGVEAVGGGRATVPSPAVRRRGRRRRTSWRARFEIALLAGPAILIFVGFVILPVGLAAYYGFYRWKGYGPPTDWVGLHNYYVIFTDSDFQAALRHNIYIVLLSLLIQGPLAILLALLLNRDIRGRNLIRVLIFVPWVISEVIAGTGWSLILATNGAFNDLLRNVGLGRFTADWLSDPHWALWSLMAILTWKYLGFAVLLFMAGMQNIPEEVYEAASIDGASYWQLHRRITLPLLAPTIRIWAFLSIIGSLQLFDLVYIIWGQYVAGTAGVSTMATYMVQNGRNAGNYGYGNAVAVVLFLISLFIALVYQRFVLRRDTEGAITIGDKR